MSTKNTKEFHPFWETVKYVVTMVLTAPIRLVQAMTLFLEKKAGIDVSKQEQAANRELREYEQRKDANKFIKQYLDDNFKEQISERDATVKQTELDIVSIKSSVAENGAKDILYQFDVTLRNGLEYSIFANTKNEIMDSSICPDEVKLQMQEMFKAALLDKRFIIEDETGIKEETVIQAEPTKEPVVSRTSNGIIDFREPGDNAFAQASYLFRKENIENAPKISDGKAARDLAVYIDWKLKHGDATDNMAFSYNGTVVSVARHDNLLDISVKDIKSGIGGTEHTVSCDCKNVTSTIKQSLEQIRTAEKAQAASRKADAPKKEPKKAAPSQEKTDDFIPYKDGMCYVNMIMSQSECKRYDYAELARETSAVEKAQIVINILCETTKEEAMTVYDKNMMFVRSGTTLSVFEFGKEEPIAQMEMDNIGTSLANAIRSVEPSSIDYDEIERDREAEVEADRLETEKSVEPERSEAETPTDTGRPIVTSNDDLVYNDEPEPER